MDTKRQKKDRISHYLLKKRRRTFRQIKSSSLTTFSKNSCDFKSDDSEIDWNFKQFLGFNWKDPSFSRDIKHLSKY